VKMNENSTIVPIVMMEAALNSGHAADLIAGRDTHMPALHFVGEIVRFTQDADWIKDIVAGYLPLGYKGNTLAEIAGMMADSVKKGFARSKASDKAPSAADVGLSLVRGPEISLFHTAQNVGFIAVSSSEHGTVCHPVRSEATKGLIRLRYHRSTGKTISKEALAEVIDMTEAHALYEAPQEVAHVRIAGTADAVYYDLGRPDGTIVKITATAWTLVRNAPVYFYRPDGFAAQVIPKNGGNLNHLKELLQLEGRSWVLFIAFLLVCLRPTHPYIWRCLSAGPMGAAKVSSVS
jgi:hypothetical protein